ncbi:MAG: O-antigen ligase family protein [Cyanobacteria bacterium J06621_8]
MWFDKLKTKVSYDWLGFSLSIFILPLFPALGALGLVIVLFNIWLLNHQKIIQNKLNQGFFGLTGLLIISCLLAEYPSEAWLGLANFLPFFALFIALRLLITTPQQLKRLSWLLILPSLPIVVLGLGQMYGSWATPTIIESILGWDLVPLGEPAGRMSAVFIYANFLAIYLAIAFTLTGGLLLDTWQTRGAKLTRQQGLTLVLLGLILLADLDGLILTSSRNAWGLAVFSFMVYAVYLGWRWLVWGVVGAATVVGWASFVPNLGGTQLRLIVPAFIWQRLSDQLYDRPVETLRVTQWQFCGELIQQRPIFGWGLRNFTPLYEAKMNFWFGHPHNLWIMLGAETGILATVLLTVLVGSIMVRAGVLIKNWSSRDSPLILLSYAIAFSCYILFNLTDLTVFDLRINTIAWVLLAAISGVSNTISRN